MAYQQENEEEPMTNPRDEEAVDLLLDAIKEYNDERIALGLIEAVADVNFTFDDGKSLLQQAISYHRYSIACALIDAGADVNKTDDEGETALMYCVKYSPCSDLEGAYYQKLFPRLNQEKANVNINDKEGKTAVVHYRPADLAAKLLEGGADVNKPDNEGRTVLMYAVQFDRPDLAAQLLKAGADVNVTDNEGRTALMYLYVGSQDNRHRVIPVYLFYSDDDYEIVLKILFDAGADINVTDNKGKTALEYSLEYDKKNVACALIDAGADVNVIDRHAKTALLLYSISTDNQHVACALIDVGADVNAIKIHDKTALLFFSSSIGNQTVIQEIIKSGIDINVKDDQGKTALMYALQNSHESLVHALLDAGADHNIIDNNGQSALFFAAIQGNESVVQRLINAGADLNITDNEGKTALMYAIQENKENIACALLDADADHSVIDNNGQSALFFAAIRGSESVVQRLIKAGADLNITDKKGKTTLASVIQKNKKNIACALLDAGADHSVIDYNGQSALFFAAIQGNERAVQRLIEAGADLITDNEGKTTLMYVIQENKENIACALLDAGADHNIIDNNGKSALFFAAIQGNERVVKRLIEAGADLNSTDNEGKTTLMYVIQENKENIACTLLDAGADHSVIDNNGQSALFFAAIQGNERVVQRLIEAGADLNLTDNEGKTTLMYVIQENKENIACTLLDAGADHSVIDNNGQSALDYSLEYDNQHLACALIDAGADVNVINRHIRTALLFCSSSIGNRTVIQEIIKSGIDINIKDDQGKTALMYALQNNHESLVHALLDAGADHTVIDNNGQSALFFAAIQGNESVVQRLIKAGADLNSTDNEGKTALVYAIQKNKENIACALLDAGADHTVIDNNGQSALFFAAIQGNESVVQRLIKAGADLNITDNKGKTALMYAIQQNKKNIACALLDAGADYSVIDKNDQSALFFAAIKGNEGVVQRLINTETELNNTDNKGKTALMYAIQENKENIACALLDANADHSVIDNNGQSALFFGAIKANESVVQRLIKAGANLNITDDRGETALMHAIKQNNGNIACVLIDAGADHTVIDNNGQSALFFAAIQGNESVVQRLIKAGADLNITDNQGMTALMYAACHDRDGIAAKLIDAGVDVNATDNNGKTALIYYAEFSTYERYMYELVHDEKVVDKIAKMMIRAKADVNITDDKGKTALMYAVKNGCESLACVLIDAGGNVNIIDKHGNSALSYSIQTEDDIGFFFGFHEGIAFKLIEAGADVSLIGETGRILLLYAIDFNNKKLVDALIEAGADVNVTDNEGKSAVRYSVQSDISTYSNAFVNSDFLTSSESITCKLIKADADVDIADNEGTTPLLYAVQHNDRKLTNLLIEAGADINVSDHYGKTALFYSLGHKDIIQALIEKGNATVNKRDRYGRSVLFYSFTESLDSTQYLLEKGGNLNVKDNCNMSIISFCIENLMNRKEGFLVHFSKLNTLLKKQMKLNTVFEAIINSVFCKIFHCKALLQMKKGRKFEMAEASFDQGNSTDAAHRSRLDVRNIIEALQSAREYIAEQDTTQRKKLEKVLDMFMQEDRYLYTNLQKITGLLVELGANPNYADSDGNTALHFATCLPLFETDKETIAMTMCQKLEGLGASFHARNHQYETPLLFCLSKKEWINTSQTSSKVKILVEVCKYLLDYYGSSIEETTRSGKTVFHLIMELFQEGFCLNDERKEEEVLAEILKLLKLFPCSRPLTEMTVNKKDANLNSPLHLWAMLELHLSSNNDHSALKKKLLGTIFKHLVACGAKLNERNKNDETPLHLCRSWTAVKLLIDGGAAPKVLDSEGRTPLLVASGNMTHKGGGHIYQEFSQEPKAFWQTVLEDDLDPWAVDNHGTSVLSNLILKESFDLSKALVEVACEEGCIQNDTAVSLLNAVCQDSSTHNEWKSILVKIILKSRKAIKFPRNEETALHLSCRNIVEFTLFTIDVDVKNVHFEITKQLLKYGLDPKAPDASGHSCLDIAKKCPALKDLLLKPQNMDEVPLVFPWTSISTKYKPMLSKVARQQECKQLDSFWYHQNSIQKGSFGLVFVGMNENDGREVAIKRIEKLRNQQLEADKKEIKHLTSLADCEQVVRYLSYSEDEHFSYVVLELMEGNLNDYLDGASIDDTKSVELCGDMLGGLKYLHQHNILHRDVKPSNILFKTYPKLCLKLADFGLSRRIDTLGTYTTSSGSVVGTRCWIAPEVLKSSSRKTKHQRACDVFSAGLVLHYILSGKEHPFSPADRTNKSDLQISNETESNVINGRMEGFRDTLCLEATDLVHSMLDSNQTKRPTAAQALTHPFFWSKKKKMDFLSAVGNQPEIECPRAYLHTSKRTLPLTSVEYELDGKLKSIIMTQPLWNDANYVRMPAIYTEMTKKRKPYNTSSVVELVRFIRNTLAHVSEEKRAAPVRKLVLEDFVFLEYFPNLVIEVFKCVKKHGWDSREEIKYQLS